MNGIIYILASYLGSFFFYDFRDALAVACTHYPLLWHFTVDS